MLCKVLRQIEQGMLETDKRPYVIAIDGMSGSGKTTLARQIHEKYLESNVFHMDDYFLQPHKRTEERLAEVGGNVDYERFKDEIIECLGDGEGLVYHAYDCSSQTLGKEIHVPWSSLVIIEGVYSQHPYLGDVYDLRIFCEVSEEEQLSRIRERNGEVMLERFVNEWIPKENAYFEKYRIKEESELVLP